jgi:tetratricopeptide (TPR) repeat protein
MPSETPIVDPRSHEGAPGTPRQTFEAQAGNAEKSAVVQGHGNQVTYENVTLKATVPGAVVVMPSQDIVFSKRSGPIELRQKKPNLLDRDHECAACLSSEPTIIKLFGESGIGKSTVLASLAHDLPNGQPSNFSDGVAYCGVQEFSFDEVLFEVWSLFYQASVSWTVRPSSAQQRLHLRDISALLLLDDVSLSGNEIRSLYTALPRSTVILSAEDQEILGFGSSIPLSGLPFECIGHLAEIQLRRMAFQGPNVPSELLESSWREHQGNPYLIGRDIASWALTINRQILPGLQSETASSVLGAVQALGKPVSADVLEAVVDSPSAGDIAEDLVRSGQLKANSPRYSNPWPRDEIPSALADQYRARALTYLGQSTDLLVPSDLPLALRLLQWSVDHPEHKACAVAMARKLSDAFMTSGYFDRWSESLQAALSIADATEDTETGAWARHNLGTAAFCRGDLAEARAYLREALKIRRDNKADADAIDATETLLRETEARSGESGPSGTGSAIPMTSGPIPSSGGSGSVAKRIGRYFRNLRKQAKERAAEKKQRTAEEEQEAERQQPVEVQ